MDEEFESVQVKNIRFRKGKRFAHKASKPLTQGVVETLNVSRLPTFLAKRLMVCAQMTKDVGIGFPKITEGSAVAIRAWNPEPESPTDLFTTVTNEEGDNLPGASTESQPNPTLVLLATDEASHLVEFQHILRCRRFKEWQGW